MAERPDLARELLAAFPPQMQERARARDPPPPAAQRDHRDQGRQPDRQPARHQRALRADRGGRRAFDQAAAAFVAAERLFGMDALWAELERPTLPERVRLELFAQRDRALQLAHRRHAARHLARHGAGRCSCGCGPAVAKLDAVVAELRRPEARAETGGPPRPARARWARPGRSLPGVVRLFEMNGAVGLRQSRPQVGGWTRSR